MRARREAVIRGRWAATFLLAGVALVSCGGAGSGTAPTTPPAPSTLPPAAEPAVAPSPAVPPAGRVVELGSPVEGVVVDGRTRTVVAALRDRRLALLDADTAAVRATVTVPGTARHLRLARPGGPVLVPGEDADLVAEVDLPKGRVIHSTRVGRQPHDAAFDAASGRIVVTDELGGSVSFVANGVSVARVSGPVQPGGDAVAAGRAAVVDVRGNRTYVYDVARARQIAVLPTGAGPTHVVALDAGFVAVADTRGDGLFVFRLAGDPRQLLDLPVPGHPYGLAADPERHRLYVALSATNQLLRFDVHPDGTLQRVGPAVPTVQQPNSVGVDPTTGTLFVGSSAAPGSVQVVAPPAG